MLSSRNDQDGPIARWPTFARPTDAHRLCLSLVPYGPMTHDISHAVHELLEIEWNIARTSRVKWGFKHFSSEKEPRERFASAIGRNPNRLQLETSRLRINFHRGFAQSSFFSQDIVRYESTALLTRSSCWDVPLSIQS
jgi:hypothetical protein